MTKNSARKARVRAYQTEHGVKYTTALRAASGEGHDDAPPPPRPPDGLDGDAGWFDAVPTADALLAPVLSHVLGGLNGERLEDYELGLPSGAPPLRDPWLAEVSPREDTLELQSVDSYGDAELANATMRADVRVAGELNLADAIALEAAGVVRRLPAGDTEEEVTVELIDMVELEVEAAVLYELVAETTDLQTVLSHRWVSE